MCNSVVFLRHSVVLYELFSYYMYACRCLYVGKSVCRYIQTQLRIFGRRSETGRPNSSLPLNKHPGGNNAVAANCPPVCLISKCAAVRCIATSSYLLSTFAHLSSSDIYTSPYLHFSPHPLVSPFSVPIVFIHSPPSGRLLVMGRKKSSFVMFEYAVFDIKPTNDH